ncbi:MAG: response regulator [Oligoflexia bacterium]|nr:response regulator [Oligoflexia bacterium]
MITEVMERIFARRPGNLEQILVRLVGGAAFERIKRSTPDRRELPLAVAQFLGVSEEFVMEQAAQILRLPLLRRVPEVEICSAAEAEALLAYLQQGAVPLGGLVQPRAVVCVNPEAAGSVLIQNRGLPIYLATWSQVRQAGQSASSAGLSEAQLRTAAAGTLVELLKVCEDNGASECTILQIEGQLAYEFAVAGGKVGQGVVHRKVAPALRDLLAGLAPGPSVFRRRDGSLIHFEGIEFGVQQFRVGLRWKPQASALLENKPAPANVIPFVREEQKSPPEATAELKALKKKVLIIDDNSTFSRVLERFLQRFEVEIVIQNKPEDALALVQRQLRAAADLIICDLHMPGMSGSDFVMKLRKIVELKDLPLIVLTSDHDIETELRLLRQGADVFVSKSEDPRLLAVHVEKLLERANCRSVAA